jgi:hypothetical protein
MTIIEKSKKRNNGEIAIISKKPNSLHEIGGDLPMTDPVKIVVSFQGVKGKGKAFLDNANYLNFADLFQTAMRMIRDNNISFEDALTITLKK